MLIKILKIFNPNRMFNQIKIDAISARAIFYETRNNPRLIKLMIDNLLKLIKNLDARLMDEQLLKSDYAMLSANLIGQRKAYYEILDLLTTQEIEKKDIINDA